MVNVSSILMSREDVVEIAFRLDPACTLVSENYELNTTVKVINEKVNNFNLLHYCYQLNVCKKSTK